MFLKKCFEVYCSLKKPKSTFNKRNIYLLTCVIQVNWPFVTKLLCNSWCVIIVSYSSWHVIIVSYSSWCVIIVSCWALARGEVDDVNSHIA